MKNSQVILGASAIVLSIAAAFTTKGNNKLVVNAKHINSSLQCTDYTTSGCSSNVSTCFTANGKTAFTTGGCVTPLRTHS